MKKINCHSILKLDCKFSVNSEIDDDLLLLLLNHINEIHDPRFVTRCQDDLIAEYDKYTKEIKLLLNN